MRLLSIAILVLISFFHQPVFASSESEALGKCLGDFTNGKERKELARWVFIAMTSHPELQSVSAVKDADRVEANQEMAALVTRLISEQCVAQTKAVIKSDGKEGFVAAFKMLGELAMAEIMGNKEVIKSISGYTKFLDQKKLDSVFGTK